MEDSDEVRSSVTASRLNRFSNSVLFAIPVRTDRMSEFYDMRLHENLCSGWLDEDVAKVLAELAPEDAKLAAVEAGRGGSGVAIGLEILSVTANVGGVLGLGLTVAQAVGVIARKMKSTKRGIISLSQGAAAMLAADESLRRHSGKSVRLAAFGALDIDTDGSYSEFDVFWAIVEQVEDEIVEFYIISDKAEVTLAGSVPRPPDPYKRSWSPWSSVFCNGRYVSLIC